MKDVGRRGALRAAGSAALLAGLSGCLAIGDRAERATPIDPGGEGTAAGNEPVKEAGQFRLINAAPTPVQLIYSADPLFGPIPFGGETDYSRVPGGTQKLVVQTAGNDPESLFSGEFIHNARPYTAIVLPEGPSGADGEGNAPKRLIVLTDVADVPQGQSLLRFTHTSPDAPPVTVSTAGGRVLFERVAFGETVKTALSAGSYALRVAPAGESGGGGGGDPLETRDVTLDAGRFYTALAMGYVNAGGSKPSFRLRLYPTATYGDRNR